MSGKIGAFHWLYESADVDDMKLLLEKMNLHSRRKRAERYLGPIKTVCQYPPIPIRSLDWCAYFDDHLDVDCPSWVQASGATEEEALRELLDGAADEIEERAERAHNDALYQGELQRRGGCNEH